MEKTVKELSDVLGDYVPNLLGALAILVVGWIVARIIAAIFSRALRRTNLDNRLAHWLAGTDSAKAVPLEKWIGKAVFYLLMIFVLVAFFEALDLTLPTEPLNRLLVQLFHFVPQLVGAAILLAIAWLLATVVRMVIVRVLKAMNIDERLASQTATSPQVSLTRTIADTAYWLVFLLFVPAVLNALALQGLMVPAQDMIDKIVTFLPNIFTAVVILAIGWFVARIVRGIVTNLLAAAGADALSQRVGLAPLLATQSLSGLLGLVAYVLILVPVLIAALEALALEAVTRPTSNMLNSMLAALPAILAAALIVLIAYVVGRLVATLVSNVLGGIGFNAILLRLGLARETSAGQRTPAEVVGYLVFIAVMLVAATEAARQLGFVVLADLVTGFLVFAGQVILGLIIFGIGLYLANVASATVKTSGMTQAGFLALATRVSIIVLAGAMALRQMGLANEIINLAFGLMLGGTVLAVALAVGLGAREVAGREVEEFIRSVKSKSS